MSKAQPRQHNDAFESVMTRIDAQPRLFAQTPNWSQLIKASLPVPPSPPLRVHVLRNYLFEPMAGLMERYMRFSGRTLAFSFSAYDDSLSFNDEEASDAVLIWVDAENYRLSDEELVALLSARCAAIRRLTSAPIVLAVWFKGDSNGEALKALFTAQTKNIPGTYFTVVNTILASLPDKGRDDRMRAVSGTAMSREAQALLARELACRWLASVLLPPIKAVAVDLDNTLYEGVLGEDGAAAVSLSPGHRLLQTALKRLSEKGVFLGLISRNEEADVRALFEKRSDFPLRWEHFSAVEISWRDKEESLQRLAQTLQIGVDSVLVIDDNPGELASIGAHHADVKLMLGMPDGGDTERGLAYYPGVWQWRRGREDAVRVRDMAANLARGNQSLQIEKDDDFFRSLKIRLTFYRNATQQAERIAELSRKTNQFNLRLRRYTVSEVHRFLHSRQAEVASVALSDRLSDSGIIASVIAEREGKFLLVKEVCMSCRALGRRLEDVIILRALRNMKIFAGCEHVVFLYARRERNAPALNWLVRNANNELVADGDGRLCVAAKTLANLVFSDAVEYQDE